MQGKKTLTSDQEFALRTIKARSQRTARATSELRGRALLLEREALEAMVESMYTFLRDGGSRKDLEKALGVTRRKFDSDVLPKIEAYENRWNRKPWGDKRRG